MVVQFDVNSFIKVCSANLRSTGCTGVLDTQLFGASDSRLLAFRRFGFARVLAFDVMLSYTARTLNNVIFCAVCIPSHHIVYVATRTNISLYIINRVFA